ncbi:uncharacterized protein [Asterias amurensis]|uniref:uncharacterized protein n=1 Tax=Asterias amurensis TaxID=7602 RepID=UPI003AB23CD5
MCSAFTASDGPGQPTVLRDKLITAFKTNCRPTIKICSFDTAPSDPIRYTVLKDAFRMPFRVNFSVKASQIAKLALSGNGTDASIFTAICIGCGWGDETIIRACHPYTCYTRLEIYDEAGILDPSEYRSFWIEYEMGTVRIGKGGVTDAILEWNAEAYHGRVPTQVYVGVSTASSEGSWKFC